MSITVDPPTHRKAPGLKASSPATTAAPSAAHELTCSAGCGASLQVSIEEIGKAEAEAILAIPSAQRLTSQVHVGHLARMMTEGLWHGISVLKLDKNGGAGDAKHRLTAVVQSDTRHHFLVIRDVPDIEFLVTDTNRKRDKTAMFTIAGATQPGPRSSAINYLLRWTKQDRPFGRDTVHFSELEMVQAMGEYPEVDQALDWALPIANQKVFGPHAVWTALLAKFAALDLHEAEEFAARVNDGVGLSAGSPIGLLRSMLTTESHDALVKRRKLNSERVAGLVIMAWNAVRESREPKQLRVKLEKFPVPV